MCSINICWLEEWSIIKKRENIWERKLELVVTALDWWVRSNFSKMTYPVILEIRRNQLCELPGEASSWHNVGAPRRKGTCGESSTRSSLGQRWSKDVTNKGWGWWWRTLEGVLKSVDCEQTVMQKRPIILREGIKNVLFLKNKHFGRIFPAAV